MFQIKWCTKQKMFSMYGVPFVEELVLVHWATPINLLQHTRIY